MIHINFRSSLASEHENFPIITCAICHDVWRNHVAVQRRVFNSRGNSFFLSLTYLMPLCRRSWEGKRINKTGGKKDGRKPPTVAGRVWRAVAGFRGRPLLIVSSLERRPQDQSFPLAGKTLAYSPSCLFCLDGHFFAKRALEPLLMRCLGDSTLLSSTWYLL